VKKRLLVIVLLSCIPLTVWAFVKPARALEAFTGVSCVDDTICTDDMARYREASELYAGALHFLASSITPLQTRPLIVFCASETCYRSFGFSKTTANSIGRFCIVIGPRGWKPYVIRHEMIHRLQVQELGLLKMYREPAWFLEGMAYALSEDPRAELDQPHQQYRSQFQAWYAKVGRDHLWNEASLP
jgi:hypothetical protein